MIRLRRLPATRVLRRARYEVEFGADDPDRAGQVVITTTPATLIDTRVGVAEAWTLVRAADAGWTDGTGPWVGPGAAAADEPEPGTGLSRRHFELWEFDRGHGLLVRSPKDATHSLTVDLLFDEVTYVGCRRELPGVEVVRADGDDLARLPDPAPSGTVFVLLSDGVRNLVVASALRVVEHEGDPALSPFRPAPFTGRWWGRVFSDKPAR